jgi:enamine deaminase RidA (YjgF/YER057c/UK114 family)
VYVSGQVAVDARGNVVGEGDAARQSAQVFDNMEAALKAAGATLQDVTKITAFLVNQPDYAAYAAERLKRFGDNGPASSTVIVKGLVNPKCLIEVEAIAVVE